MNVRKIAAAAARDNYLSPDLSIMLDHQRPPAAFSRFDRAKKPRSSAANDDYIVFHLSQITGSQDIYMMRDVSCHNVRKRPD